MDTRDNNFDFVRLALAVGVIYSHAYALTSGDGHGDLLFHLTGGITEVGAMAVNGFFVISGFLIAASWERSSSTFSYLRKRVCRIYPGFIVAWIIGCFAIAPIAAEALRYEGVLKSLAGLVLLNRLEPTGAFEANPYPGVINGSLWTISYEFRCYLIVLALGLMSILQRRSVMLALTIACIALYSVTAYVNLPTTSGEVAAIFGRPERLVRLLAYFLAGATIYTWRIKPTGGIAAGMAVLGCAAFVDRGVSYAVLPVAFSYALLWFCFTPSVRLRGWARFGDFSYGTYLYAFPIQQLLVYWTTNTLSPLIHFSIAAPLAVLAGVLSWHGVEKWFMVRRRHAVPATSQQPVTVSIASVAMEK